MFGSFRVPQASTLISWIALGVALGGTAYAAASHVAISDNSGTRIAVVDTLGRLKTAASPIAPTAGFAKRGYAGVEGSGQVVLGPSQATVVLTNITVSNDFDQTTGASAGVVVRLVSGATSNCAASATRRHIGMWQARPGVSVPVAYPSGIPLAPAKSGDYWCLMALAFIEGSPGTYLLPSVDVAGYVQSGTFNVPAASGPASAEQLRPRNR